MLDVDIRIAGYRLVKTCVACPEQYDVYNSNNSRVGYLRLRHGCFRADCPDVGGDTVYEAHTRGDGCFDDDERMPQLTAAIHAINEYWKKTMEMQNAGRRCNKRGCANMSGCNGDSGNNLADQNKSVMLENSEPVPGFVHPKAYSGDVLGQLRNWRSRHIAHTTELMDMAIAEIVRLRKLSFRYAARLSRADAEINDLKSQLEEPPAFEL